MFSADQYKLLDFGAGEKLEQFLGQVNVRRPSPGTLEIDRAGVEGWDTAARFEREFASWSTDADRIQLVIEHRGIKFHLRPTPTGQIGLFPEQVKNWDWILDHPKDLTGLRAINLFGYTGGTTMALAQRGVAVTHVDAAKSVVAWARDNARESGLEQAPIRWIVEDAVRFLKREIKRGNEYQIVVADPPSFGRGPKNEVWKIQRDLEELVDLILTVTNRNCQMLILSCHTPEYTAEKLKRMVGEKTSILNTENQAFDMSIPVVKPDDSNAAPNRNPRRLYSGSCFRMARVED